MSIDKIRQAVLFEATAEANRIVESAKNKSAAINDAQKTQITQEMEKLYASRVQAIENEYNRKLIQQKGVSSKQVLEKRNMVLSSVFKKAREEILNWPEGRYGEFMGRLVEKIVGNSGGRLVVHRDEREIFTLILTNINAKSSSEARIVLDETNHLSERGGFIFVGRDYEVDQTLEAMLKDIEQEMLPIIAKELFSG